MGRKKLSAVAEDLRKIGTTAIAAGGWQQHRLTQAPLKTLRKTEALGASLDNIV